MYAEAYASRALTDTQQRYALVEKDLLAIVFGCEKFHDFVYGRQVEVETDHKPRQAIFRKPLNETPLRLQRMLLRLQRYDLNVVYVAHPLSRAYMDISSDDQLEEELDVCVVWPMSDERLQQLQYESKTMKTISF